jgi:hypothetical protein
MIFIPARHDREEPPMSPEQEQPEELTAGQQDLLQEATDRESRPTELLSNVLKKVETTADTQVQT